MNVLDLNKPSKHPCFECFVKHSTWYFLIDVHMLHKHSALSSRIWTPTWEFSQVFAATIKQLNFNYVWGWKDSSKLLLRLPANLWSLNLTFICALIFIAKCWCEASEARFPWVPNYVNYLANCMYGLFHHTFFAANLTGCMVPEFQWV